MKERCRTLWLNPQLSACQADTHLTELPGLARTIFSGCEVWIKNSFTSVTVRHHEASRAMPNSYSNWQNFQFASNNHYWLFFLHTFPLTITFKLRYSFLYQFNAKNICICGQEMLGSAPIYDTASKCLAENRRQNWNQNVEGPPDVMHRSRLSHPV